MAAHASLKKDQKTMEARLWSARYSVKEVQDKYATMPFDERRNIHLQGARTRFLLAGAVQHEPSLNKFEKVPTSARSTAAGGPSELCPLIDIFDDFRIAQRALAEWQKHPSSSSAADINRLIAKAEKIAAALKILLEAIERGGDQTPAMPGGSESFIEYCDRVKAHHTMIMATTGTYDGSWENVPHNDFPLSSQQVINNWNAVCHLVKDKAMSLDDAIALVRYQTRSMWPHELKWEGQTRTWFAYGLDL